MTDERLAWDIEADGLLDSISRIHMIVTNNLDRDEIKQYVDERVKNVFAYYDGFLPEALEKLSEASLIVGHNILGYDIPAIQKVLDPNFKPKGIVRDTLLISRLIWTNLKDLDFNRKKAGKYPEGFKFYGQHGLKAWGYRLGVFKGDFGESDEWAVATQEMLDYCVQDTVVTKKLWELIESKKYSEESIELEHAFYEVIKRQIEYGFKFDVKKAGDLYADLVSRRLELKSELQEVFQGWTQYMKTPKEYIIDLKARGIVTDVTKAKVIQKTYHLIKNSPYPMTKAALGRLVKAGELRSKHIAFNPSSRHHIAKALKERYDWQPKEFTEKGDPIVNESVLESLIYPEAKLIAEYLMVEKRIGQLAEGKQAWLKLEKDGRIHGNVITNGAVTGRCTHNHPNVAQTPACGAPYGEQCRDLFTVDDGYVLVGADASGLELRCLAHYMAAWDGGAYGDVILNGDIHSVNQKAAGLPTRNNAKTFIYGFLYGAGDLKIGEIVGGNRHTGKQLKEKFLKELPALGGLVKAVKAKANKRKYLLGLDGRHLHIRSDHAALNTLLQSAGALVMKKALVFCDQLLSDAGFQAGGIDYEFVANVHDEYQVQVRKGIEDQVGEIMVKSMQMAGEYFNFRCPIDGEYQVGNSWATTH